MDKVFAVIKGLIAFDWAKGWRTWTIVGITISAYVAEDFLGLDIPGVEVGVEEVMLALGISAAAHHEPKAAE